MLRINKDGLRLLSQTTGQVHSLFPKKEEAGAKIDLLLDRNGQSVNICKTKFANRDSIIAKKYANELNSKLTVFQTQTKTKKAILPKIITIYWVKQNIHYTTRIVLEIKMEDVFK